MRGPCAPRGCMQQLRGTPRMHASAACWSHARAPAANPGPHQPPRREGTSTWEDLNLDDVDVRFKFAGLFHRGKRTPKRFMMRLKVGMRFRIRPAAWAPHGAVWALHGAAWVFGGVLIHSGMAACMRGVHAGCMAPCVLPGGACSSATCPRRSSPPPPRIQTPQLPNGEVSSEQLRYVADCLAPYGTDGCADITTRANLQVSRTPA